MYAVKRWVGAGVFIASGVSGVLSAGCGGSEVPGPAPTPSVVWSAGEPMGEFESDPWVQAVRASALPEAVAINALDTRSASLHETWTPASIRYLNSHLNEFARENNDHGAYRVPGPRPFDPVVVEVAEDGQNTKVRGCTVFDWSITEDDGSFDDGTEFVKGNFDVVMLPDGTYQVDRFTLSGAVCESQNLTIGTFDPLPDGKWEYWQEDILKGGFADVPLE